MFGLGPATVPSLAEDEELVRLRVRVVLLEEVKNAQSEMQT
jgi:hypothetical protein